MDDAELIGRAIEAAQKAYAPYSKYSVGAALIGKDGRVFLGCNVENASYGLTICAERNAIFRAVADGCTEFEKIAVVTKDGGSPCGACRQVLSEFGPMQVILGRLDGQILDRTTVADLLPNAFGG